MSKVQLRRNSRRGHKYGSTVNTRRRLENKRDENQRTLRLTKRVHEIAGQVDAIVDVGHYNRRM